MTEHAGSNGLCGLTTEQAAQRRREAGENQIERRHGHSPWIDFFTLFTNPLAVILLLACAISAAIGERFDAGLIAALVLIGTTIDFLQTYRSRRTIERLRSTVATTASVLRDGKWTELPRIELVPDDVVRLAAGDLVPADCRLLESKDLYVQQSALTGESVPAEKDVDSDVPGRDPNAKNMVFVGTSVVSGFAMAKVIATGARTAFGDIVARLAEKAPETAFDIGLRRFGYLITRFVLGLVLFVVLVSITLHHPPLESLLFAVSLAVGLTPEFLPMITSVTLSRGALAMAARHVIVKRLPAIQNLGSIDTLCTDKTGTLTTGRLQIKDCIDSTGAPSSLAFYYARLNSALQSGIRSPLDAAILERAGDGETPSATKIDEVPFDFQRRRLSIVIEDAASRTLICKGAPESIFPLVRSIDREHQNLRATPELMAELSTLYQTLSGQGLRVLAVAVRDVPHQPGYGVADEQELTFLGFIVFADPILPEAAETIAKLRQDGVEVKILSGDSELVTAHICRQAGLEVTGVVLGDELENTTDTALLRLVQTANVFARLSPAQKVRVLSTLRRAGRIVGFMGDGINDAPAMHAADIGIAAPHAVDVAQDASDVVLLQPGLAVLHEGILEGRRAFGNVMKYLLMGTSSNFGNVLSMAVAAVILPFLPMLPAQVLLNNFLYDLSQLTIPLDRVDPDYIRKPQHWDIGAIQRFMVFIGPISSLYDFLTFFVLLHVFHATAAEFHTGWFVESLATQTLVLLVIRTAGSPFRSRPAGTLVLTVALALAAGLWLPFSFFSTRLRFTPLPGSYFAFLAAATLSYLALVEFAKRRLLQRATS